MISNEPRRIFVQGEILPAEFIGSQKANLSEFILSGILKENAHNEFSFSGPGIALIRGQLFACLPRTYKPFLFRHPDSIVLVVGLLLKTLRKYKLDTDKKKAVRDETRSLLHNGPMARNSVLDRMCAAIELLEEFRHHGQFVLSIKKTGPNIRGRTHWKQTLQSFPPAGHPKNEVFQGFVQSRTQRTVEHPLCRVHRLALVEARAALGFGFGREQDEHLRRSSRVEVLRTINEHKHEVFSDRARRIIILLNKLYKGGTTDTPIDDLKISYMFAPKFHHVWEAMLSSVLRPLSFKKTPSGEYLAGDKPLEKHYSEGLRHIPDIVLEDDKGLYILDAKDYPPGDYPKTHDISKQILYRLLYSNLFDDKNIDFSKTHNAFLLPGNTKNGVTHQGRHRFCNDDPQGWGNIACLTIDYERVARAYVSNRTNPEIRTKILEKLKS